MELKEKELNDLDFDIINSILEELHNMSTLHIDRITEICSRERGKESIEYAIAIRNILLKYNAAIPSVNTNIIGRNKNSIVFARSEYFRDLKKKIIDKEKYDYQSSEKELLEIKHLKQQTGVSFAISIIAILISLISIGITIYLFYKDL